MSKGNNISPIRANTADDVPSGTDNIIPGPIIVSVYCPPAPLVLMGLDEKIEGMGEAFSKGQKYFVIALGLDNNGDCFSQTINDTGRLIWIPCNIGHYGVMIQQAPPMALPILGRGGRS